MQLAPLSASPLRFMFCCIGSRQTLRASNTSLRHAKVLLGQRTQRWELASPLKPRAPGTRTMAYLSYDYEVFGKVQGVFFRSSTVDEAKKLGVVGWVKNTSAGTVQGQAQGKPDAAGKLKTFLKEVGSPSSHIDKCIISNEKNVEKLEFSGFEER